MNYAQIQQFLTIAKHMSLTKAAKELYITQPALSHSLAKMEKELGLHLFYRMGNQLVLTAEGDCLMERFRKISDAYAGLYEDARMLSEKQEEKILLGFSGSALIFSALFVTGFLTSYKGLPIEKVFAGHSQIRTMLVHEQLDFAITYPPITGPQIGSRMIYEDRIVLAMSSAHPLADKTQITVADLGHYTFTVLTRANPFRQNCDSLLKKEGIRLPMVEYDYADYIQVLENSRGTDSFLGFTTENSFYKWYGEGYVSRNIANLSLSQVTGISWLLDQKTQYRYSDLLEQIVHEYPAVYDNYKYHTFFLRDFDS